MQKNADVLAIHPVGQIGRKRTKTRPTGAVIKKVIKGIFWPPLARDREFMWTNANPVDLAGDRISAGVVADAADTDDCVERKLADRTHAVVNAKAPARVRVAMMGSLINQNSH